MNRKPWPLPGDTDFAWSKKPKISEAELRAAALWELARHAPQICKACASVASYFSKWEMRINRVNIPDVAPGDPVWAKWDEIRVEAHRTIAHRGGRYSIWCADNLTHVLVDPRGVPWLELPELRREGLIRTVLPCAARQIEVREALRGAMITAGSFSSAAEIPIDQWTTASVTIDGRPPTPQRQTVGFEINWEIGSDRIQEALHRWVIQNQPPGTPKRGKGNRITGDAAATLDAIRITRRLDNGESPSSVSKNTNCALPKVRAARKNLAKRLQEWLGTDSDI